MVSVRPPATSDRSTWEDLWIQYNAFYGREGDTALSQSIVDSTWNRLLDKEEPIFGLLAEDGKEIIGLAHVVFHRNMIQIADTCYMQDLFTDPKARGLGVAQTLISAVGDLCKARGVRDIYWHTHNSNQIARSLYNRVARNTEFLVYRMNLNQEADFRSYETKGS